MDRAGGGTAPVLELAAETLARTGQLRMRAQGASMLPALWPGDELHFQRSELSGFKPGDVALFRRGDRLFVHRVLSVAANGLHAQGDALAVPDPLVAPADVLGKLCAVERRGRLRALAPPGRFLRFARELLRRSDFATRLALRWHRLASPVPA